MSHKTQVRVRFCEIDPYSHVNHSVYVQYFEDGRVEALAQAGHGLDVMLAEDAAMVITQISTRFLAPSHLGDILTIESGLCDVRRATATWLQRITRREQVVATQVARVGCTTASGRPRRFPEALADALSGYVIDRLWLGSDAPKPVCR